MLPPIEHKKFGEHHEYTVKRYTRGGERRIMQGLALALASDSVQPGLLQALDGDSRYWEEVLKECLVDAPDYWWEAVPPPAGGNGASARRVTFEYVSVEDFVALTREVQTWFESFRQPLIARVVEPGQAEPAPMVVAETVSPTFGGRAS